MKESKCEGREIDSITRKLFAFWIAAVFVGLMAAPVANSQTIAPQGSSAVFSYRNSAPITINDASPAAPYPSQITVAGVNPASVQGMFVSVFGFNHTFPDDVDIILVGPGGERSILMSDAGGGQDAVGLNFFFTEAGVTLPDNNGLISNFYKPANYDSPDDFPAPGPGQVTNEPADLTVFNGTDPNGVWKLFVVDDAGQDFGEITGGWGLTFLVAEVSATVTKTEDTNDGTCDADCSLREAIASNANTINFSSLFDTPQTITLGGSELNINKSVIINGPGADKLTISGDDSSRVFEIGSNFNVTLDGLTISNGFEQFGGGINNSSGTLNITNSTVSNNSADNLGGGIANFDGTLNITNSTVSNNSASSNGGGIDNFSGTLNITSSTVSNNSTNVFSGGGIYNGATLSNSGKLNITNSTVSNNSANNFLGGGIENVGIVNSRNSIIANNTAANGPDFSGTLVSQGYNLIENTSGTTITGDATGNQTGIDPMLAPLGNYGGTTQTHALLPGSPAIDKGISSGSMSDQRGFSRPFDVAGIPPSQGGDNSDIGAYESHPVFVSTNANSGAGSLRDTIAAASSGSDIFFDPGVFSSPTTITLGGTQILINKDLNIFGPGADKLTISGNNQSRVFEIGLNFNVTLDGMTISNGSARFGGGIYNAGFLTLTNSTVSNNVISLGVRLGDDVGKVRNENVPISDVGGGFTGGGITNDGTLNITNSTISHNSAFNFGGGIMNTSGMTNITSSTVSNNSTNDSGGGIAILNGTLNITNSTVSNNSANDAGGGIYNDFSTLNSRNTIIANNTAASSQPDFSGTLTSQGYNLIGNTANVTITGVTTGNQLNVDPMLAPLGNYGGTTQTHALLPGSPAIDKGSSSGSNTDQRGQVRPFNDPNIPDTDDGSDIGAFERRPGDFSGNRARFDLDGDGKTDIGIFRPGPGEWWYLRSSDSGNAAFQFGQASDTIVPADFTGDGKTDVAFWRAGEWFVLRSEDSSFFAFPFGTTGDIPVPGDFDGDGKADPAVFRPSNATWYYIRSSDGASPAIQFGLNGDQPIVEDYDGDGTDDLAVFRPSVAEWYLQRSTDGFIGFQFGGAGDTTPAVADFTGDGKADVTFFKPSSNEWFVLRSEDSSFFAFPFGAAGDIPIPGDYDGDGTADPAVFRPSNNSWFLLQSTSGFEQVQFGIPNDIPIPSAYVP